MATTLHLTAATWATNTYKLLTAAGGTNASKIVTTTDSGTEIQWTVSAGGAAIEWCSAPLTAAVTISSSITLFVSAIEDAMGTNTGMRARLFKVSSDLGTWTEMGGGPFDDGVELSSSSVTGMVWTATPTSNNSLAVGDRFGVRLYATNIGTMGAGTATVQHDGSSTYTASLTITEDLSFNLSRSLTQAVTVGESVTAVLTPFVVRASETTTATDTRTVGPLLTVHIHPTVSASAVTVGESVTPRLKAWYQPNALTFPPTLGGIDSGTVESAWTNDGTNLVLAEVTGTTGFDYEFSFTDVSDGVAHSVILNGYYDGNLSHVVVVQEYNFATLGWTQVGTLPDAVSEGVYSYRITGTGDYWSSGEVRIRFLHTSPGNTSHKFYVDALNLSGFLATTATDAATVGEEVTTDFITPPATALTVDVSEAVTVAEGGTLWFDELRSVRVVDVATVTLTTVSPGAYTIDVSEAVIVGESSLVVASPVAIHASESVTVGESASGFTTPILVRPMKDTGTVGEVVTFLWGWEIVVTDALTVSETVLVAVDSFHITVTDGVTVGEVVTTVVDPVAIHATETVTVGESATADAGIITLTVSVTDAVTVGERRYVTVYYYTLILAINETVTWAHPVNTDFHSAQPVDVQFTVAEPFNQDFLGERD